MPFSDSMVDRITRPPMTTGPGCPGRLGIDVAFPPACELWGLWVLEGALLPRSCPMEDAGVQVVDDVDADDGVTLRLLDAGDRAMPTRALTAGR